MKEGRIVTAVKIDGKIDTHLPDVSGNYYTLCQIDAGLAASEELGGRAVDVEPGAKITCRACHAIFKVASRYTAHDFDTEPAG